MGSLGTYILIMLLVSILALYLRTLRRKSKQLLNPKYHYLYDEINKILNYLIKVATLPVTWIRNFILWCHSILDKYDAMTERFDKRAYYYWDAIKREVSFWLMLPLNLCRIYAEDYDKYPERTRFFLLGLWVLTFHILPPMAFPLLEIPLYNIFTETLLGFWSWMFPEHAKKFYRIYYIFYCLYLAVFLIGI